MKEEKKLDSRTLFFLEKSPLLDVFWPRPGLQAIYGTVWKSAKFPPSKQKQLKWSNTAYVNKWIFTFKIKLCVCRVTKTQLCIKAILIFNVQPVKTPHFKSPLKWLHFFIAFFNVHIMNVNHAKFKKKLIVEQFQGNYLNKLCFELLQNVTWTDG